MNQREEPMVAKTSTPRLNAQPGEELDEALRFVRGYQQVLGRTFLLMATQIPRIAESTEALLQTGDDTESDSVRVSLQGTRETAERAYSELSTIAEANLRALSASEALADASNRIAEVVQAIGRVAWLLSLTGLNASVMAAHTGDSGLAFSTLTKALTSLANLTADEAKVLKDTATELEQLGRDQAARQSKQTREYRLAIQSAEAHLGEASRGVSESVATVGQTVGEAQRRTRSALGTMARIMGSIQREDILRQKIDHLVLVLDEIRDYVKDTPLESKSADELVFVEKACQLSLDLWKEIGEDIDTLVSDIVSSFEQLRPATALCEIGTDTAVKMHESALMPMKEFRDRLASMSAKATDNVGEIAEALDSCIPTVAKCLRELEDCARELAVLYVLVRIEIARTPELERAGTIASQIRAANQELSALLVETLAANRRVVEQLDVVRGSMKELERGDASIRLIVDEAEHRTKDLEEASAGFGEHLERVRNIGEEIRTRLEGFHGEVDELIRLGSERDRVVQIAEVQGAKAARLRPLRPQGEGAGSSTKMHQLVERFTVLSHKAIAARVIDVEVEEGDAGGELTLF